MKELQNIFTKLGGEFISPPSRIKEKLAGIKAFLFDWDGVFNDGTKSIELSSQWSEADAMGLNILRYSHWLEHASLPFAAIVTGLENKSAFAFAEREKMNTVYFNFKNKFAVIDHIRKEHGIQPEEIFFVFDDILDVAIAQHCGLRFMVRRNSSPLFTRFVTHHAHCDYITGHAGGHNAIREICELISGLKGDFEKVVEGRISFSAQYKKYWALRNSGTTNIFTQRDQQIVKI